MFEVHRTQLRPTFVAWNQKNLENSSNQTTRKFCQLLQIHIIDFRTHLCGADQQHDCNGTLFIGGGVVPIIFCRYPRPSAWGSFQQQFRIAPKGKSSGKRASDRSPLTLRLDSGVIDGSVVPATPFWGFLPTLHVQQKVDRSLVTHYLAFLFLFEM